MTTPGLKPSLEDSKEKIDYVEGRTSGLVTERIGKSTPILPMPKVPTKIREARRRSVQITSPLSSNSLLIIRPMGLTRQGIMGFFGGLSREDAEEVMRAAENVSYTEEEEKAVRLKIDLRILPIIVLSYICASIIFSLLLGTLLTLLAGYS